MRTIVVATFLAAAVAGCGRGDEPAVRAGDAPAILESTPWLDKVPERETDVIHVYAFGRGEGVYVSGNAYKGTYEAFRFFAEDDRLRLRFLDENKSYDARFKIESVKHRIFDWKLTLDDPPRGPKVYYGFDHDHGDRVRELPPRVLRLLRAP